MKLKYNVLIVAVLVIVDQLIKNLFYNYFYINANGDINLIGDFLSLTFVKNFGISFSFLDNKHYFILIIVSIGIAFLLYLLNRFKDDKVISICISFMLAGAIGNLIDRLIFGYVIDYISVDFGFYQFPIFNFADMCLVCAVFYMILHVFVIKKDEYEN